MVCVTLDKTWLFHLQWKSFLDPENLLGKCQILGDADTIYQLLPLHNSHGHIAWKCVLLVFFFSSKLAEYFIFTCSYLMCIQGKLLHTCTHTNSTSFHFCFNRINFLSTKVMSGKVLSQRRSNILPSLRLAQWEMICQKTKGSNCIVPLWLLRQK